MHLVSSASSLLPGTSTAAEGLAGTPPVATAEEAATTAEAQGRDLSPDSNQLAPPSNEHDSQPIMGLQPDPPDSTGAPDLAAVRPDSLDVEASGNTGRASEEQPPGGGAKMAVYEEDSQAERRSTGMVWDVAGVCRWVRGGE